jgi:hypothetical protein
MADDPKKGVGDDEASPKEAFRQGMSLLWQAARGAAGGLRKEIRDADIVGGLRDAAQEMKRAAESVIRGGPRDPEPSDVPREPHEPAEQGAPREPPKGARIEVETAKPAPEARPDASPAGPGGDGKSS